MGLTTVEVRSIISGWARQQGIHYRTAWLWFRQGKLPVPAIQTKTGTILVQEPVVNQEHDAFALYARVSSPGQKGDLDRQVARLVDWAAAHKAHVVKVVREIGSGLNGRRRGGREFRCLGCGYKDDADLNAARNILHRFLTGAYGPCCKAKVIKLYG